MIRVTERFLGPRRMELNVAKCTHMSVNLLPARKKLYTAINSRVYLGAQPLPQIGPTTSSSTSACAFIPPAFNHRRKSNLSLRSTG